MDSENGSVHAIAKALPLYGDRPLCDEVQRTSSPLHLPIPRPIGVGPRRSGETPVGTKRPLRLSTIVSHPENPPQTGEGGVCANPDRSPSVAPLVDVRPLSTTPPAPNPPAIHSRSTPTPLPHPPPKSPTHESSCLEAVRRYLATRGFRRKLVEKILRSLRASTLVVYAAKWEIFDSWCREHSLSPIGLSSARLCDFFDFLFEEKGLKPITIKGYRAAIARIYRLCGLNNPGEDEHIKALMRHYTLQRPVTTTVCPKWSLDIVLDYLRCDLFVPLGTCQIKNLSKKSLFLVTMATAFRISEIHALSFTPETFRRNHDGSLTIVTKPGFVAKNRRPSAGSQQVLLAPLPECPELCPVLHLNAYLQGTDDIRGTRTALFLPLKPTTPSITPNSLSAWIRALITDAYNWKAHQEESSPGPVLASVLSRASRKRAGPGLTDGRDPAKQSARGKQPLRASARPATSEEQFGRPRVSPSCSSPQRVPSTEPSQDLLCAEQGLVPAPNLNRSAHELRAVASSLSLARGTALTDVLKAVGWRSSSTFGKHYLRDLQGSRAVIQPSLSLPGTSH